MTLITFLAIAILGVAVFFVGWFLIWGILGLIVIITIGALIYDYFEDFQKEPRNTDDPGP